MSAFASFHAFIMWGFYALGCALLGLLVLLAIAWCWDRWCRRNARRESEERQARRQVERELGPFNSEGPL